MNEYVFKYKNRKSFFWKKEKNVIGHNFFEQHDKMVVYFRDGGLREICRWSEHEIKLGADWALSVKNNIKKETGQDISLNVGG